MGWRCGLGRVLAVADEVWRPGEELVHPVVAVEREAAAQKLEEALRARGVDQDDELRAAIARFVDAFAAAFVEGGLPDDAA